MSNLLSDQVWKLELPGPSKLILLAYANRANGLGLAWASNASLALDCSTDPRTIERHAAALERAALLLARGHALAAAAEWIVRLGEPYGPGRGRLKVYRVLPGFALDPEAPAVGELRYPRGQKGGSGPPKDGRQSAALMLGKGGRESPERAAERRPIIESDPPTDPPAPRQRAERPAGAAVRQAPAGPSPLTNADLPPWLRAAAERHAPAGAAPSVSESTSEPTEKQRRR